METTVGELLDQLSGCPRDAVLHFEQRSFYRVKDRGRRPDGRRIIQIEFNETCDGDSERKSTGDRTSGPENA